MSGSIDSRSASDAGDLPQRRSFFELGALPNPNQHAPSRSDWADVARGIGIILVVFEHAARGIVSAGLAPYSDAFKLQDAAIYSFHMPLFFFLSGCFFSRGAGLVEFARSRALVLVYPYFLWTVLVGSVVITAGELVNNPLALNALTKIFWQPIQQYWFLYALFLCHWCGFLVRPGWALAALAIALHALTAFVGLGNIALTTAHYLIYFAVGVWGAAIWKRASDVRRLHGALIAASAAIAAAVILLAHQPPYALTSFPPVERFGLAFFGVAAVIGVSIALQHKAPLLSSLGRASMAIYVMHTLFSAGARIALQHADFRDTLLHYMVGTAVGLAAPFAVYVLAKRAGVSLQVGLGR